MNTHTFKLHFTGFTTGESKGLHYLRLITDKGIFYTDKRYFQDCSLFARLKKESTIYVGAHQLKDGTFWIHWITDGEIMLEPEHAKRRYHPSFLIALISIIIFTLSGFLTLHPPFDWPIFPFMIVAILSFGLSFYQLVKLFFYIALLRHKGMRDLKEKMELARRGEYGCCQDSGETYSKQRDVQLQHSLITSLPTRYAIAEGEVLHPEFSTWTTGSGKYRRDFHGIQFQCAGHKLLFKWQVSDFIVPIPAIFTRQCPPFLAENDNVLAVYHKNSCQIDALYNITDDRVYLKRNNFCITNGMKRAAYKFFYLALPCIFLIVNTLIYYFDIESLSQWDWLKYGDSMLDMVILAFWCSNIILVIIEVVSFIMNAFSSQVDDWLKLSKILKQTIVTSGNVARIQELP
ncbi:TPA: hypothetical protein ACXNPR_002449 [Enterobacter cancerogenus]